MSDSTAEILIAIKSALQADGLDAAKAKLQQLSATHKESAAASGMNSVEQAKVDKALQNMQTTLLKLPAALRGSPEAIQSLSRDLSRMAGALAPIASIAASAFGGWKLGSLIDQTFGISDAIAGRLVPAITNIEGPARASRKALAEMDQVKFSNLEKALASAEDQFTSLSAQIDAFNQRQSAQASSRARLKSAEIDAMPDGPAKDRAQAEASFAATKEQDYLSRRQIDTQRRLSTQQAAQMRSMISTRESDIATARQAYDRAGKESAVAISSEDPERIAKANQQVIAAREDLQREQAQYDKMVPAIRKQLESIDLDLQRFDSQLTVLNNDLETAKIQRQTALSRADDAERQAQSKSSAENLRASGGSAVDQATKAAAALRSKLPGLQAEAASEAGDVSTAEADLATFQRTGKVSGRRVAGGSSNILVRRELTERLNRETQEANDAANRLTEAQSSAAQLSTLAKDVAGSLQGLSSATEGTMQAVLSTIQSLTEKITNVQSQLNNRP